jgi:hypothetical protein
VHGLAGSAAVALMVLSIIRDPILAVGYLLLFGLGTIGGMMLITLALAAPFAFTVVNLPRFNWQLRVASGLISFVFGLVPIYGIGFAEGRRFTLSDLGTALRCRPGPPPWWRWSRSPLGSRQELTARPKTQSCPFSLSPKGMIGGLASAETMTSKPVCIGQLVVRASPIASASPTFTARDNKTQQILRS